MAFSLLKVEINISKKKVKPRIGDIGKSDLEQGKTLSVKDLIVNIPGFGSYIVSVEHY